ncbi:lipid droplet-associated protein [Rhodococcus sp. NPDC060090]|uniref:lipid droplet-associated protein n=1 Tax=Rhodococcus sp. NPDC060090 TaxID=3347056 RepID=UPI0036534DD8
MIRPPFLARVAAGVAVTAYEETLRLPSTAVALPMTTVSQILQTAMRMQQVMTGLAIKGDQLFEVFGSEISENPEWAVFDEDEEPATSNDSPAKPVDAPAPNPASAPGRFALYSTAPGETAGNLAADRAVTEPPAPTATNSESPAPAAKAPATTGTTKPPAKKTPARKAPARKPAPTQTSATKATVTKTSPAKKRAAKKPASKAPTPTQPSEIAEYLDYDSLTLAQLRARLRTLSVEDLTALLTYENANAERAPFVTMLSNRISSAERK